jgi:hypothetical protein
MFSCFICKKEVVGKSDPIKLPIAKLPTVSQQKESNYFEINIGEP